jgi:DNA-binding transcriptional ArsR family regulator
MVHFVAHDEVSELVFKALADASRRALLDSLFVSDGQRLNELCAVLPELTRFGVMKHLVVLELAGLIASEKVGREKYHYLNPLPIQEIHDRWMSKYARPFTKALANLKRDLEAGPHAHPETTLQAHRRPA